MTSVPFTSQIRHKTSLRRSGLVNVRITANDGRGPEDFQFPVAELRRFAWAILADYAGAEAELAARESGVNLKQAAAPPKLQGAITRPSPSRGPKPLAADLKAVLREICRRGCATQATLQTMSLTSETGVPGALRRLADRGFIERTNSGSQGTAAVWGPTSIGWAETQGQLEVAA